MTSNDSIKQRFAAFSEVDFVDWLCRGLARFYQEKARTGSKDDPPFGFAGTLIGRRDSLLDDLEGIYRDYFTGERMLLFRRGLGLALQHSVHDDTFPQQGLSDLIYLISLCRAHESLDCIAPIIGQRKLGAARDWLQYESLSTAKALLPSREAIRLIRELVTLDTFNISFAFDILDSLCRSDYSRWAQHFIDLAPRISELHNVAVQQGERTTVEFESGARLFARSFSEFMPTSAIADQFRILNLYATVGSVYSNGAWLAKHLFFGSSPPLKFDPDKAAFDGTADRILVPISVTANSSRTAEMILSQDAYRAFMRLQSELEILSGIAPSRPDLHDLLNGDEPSDNPLRSLLAKNPEFFEAAFSLTAA